MVRGQGVGKLARRPEWDRCREQLRRGDALVVTKLNWMGRSVRHLIDVVGELDRDGVELVVLAQGIDTTSPGGRLLFQVLAGGGGHDRGGAGHAVSAS